MGSQSIALAKPAHQKSGIRKLVISLVEKESAVSN